MDASAPASFGHMLKQYRLAAGFSQEALAERAALSVRSIMYLERNAHLPYPATILRLAQALALTADQHAALIAAVQPSQAARPEPVISPRNPYKGLRAFTGSDAGDFFGRDALIASLLSTLRGVAIDGSRFLAVIGPSGSGKSSLVRAGLVPRLRQGALPGSEHWIYLDPLLPGAHPLEALTLALSTAMPGALHGIRADLDSSPRGLHLLARRMAPEPGRRAVLIVDQCEELFTLTTGERERHAFIDLLTTAAREPNGPLQVILTLRADFCDRPLMYPALGRLMEASSRFVLPMEVSELRAAIERPAALPDVQIHFEDGLVATLLSEVHGQPGGLPLLQFTLEQLFEHRDGRTLTLAAYEQLGGVHGALALQAEATYLALPSERHRRLAQALYLRLIEPGATEQDTTRRRATARELLLPDPLQTGELRTVIDAFVAARLLTTGAPAGVMTLEVSHEALIREWGRLAGWLRERREDVRLQHAISADAAAWERHGRSTDRIYRGGVLDDALAWAARNTPSMAERAFLEAGVADRERQSAAARAQHARELALARQAALRLRILAAALSVFLLVAVGLAGVALNRAQQAAHEARVAERANRAVLARQLAAQALNLMTGPYDLALLLALEATHVDTTAETRSSLLRTLEYGASLGVILHPGQGPILAVATSPTRGLLASGGADGSIRLWNVATGQPDGAPLAGYGAGVTSLAFSADGGILASGDRNGRILLWDVRRRRVLGQALPGGFSGLVSLAFDARSTLLAAAYEDGSAQLWDMRQQRAAPNPFVPGAGFVCGGCHQAPQGAGAVNPASPGAGFIASLAFDPRNALIATGGEDGSIRLWDTASGAYAGEIPSGLQERVSSLAFSPSGRLLATGGADGTISVFDVARRARRFPPLRGHAGSIASLAFSPDGRILASAGADATIRLWRMVDVQPLFAPVGPALIGHLGSVNALAFAGGGTILVSGGADGTMRLWDVTGRHPLVAAGGGVAAVAYDPVGTLLATGDADSTLRLWDPARGRLLGTLAGGHTAGVTSLAFSRGGLLASGSGDRTVRLWDLARRRPLGPPLGGSSDTMCCLAFTPDGRMLAAGSGPDDGSIRFWSIPGGKLQRLIEPPEAGTGVSSLAVSPDGRLLVAGYSDGEVLRWRMAGGGAQEALPPGAAGAIASLAFSPDSRLLAAGGEDGRISLWSVAGWRLVASLSGPPQRVSSLAFSLDGSILAAVSAGDSVRLWDVGTGQPLGEPLPATGSPTGLAYSPDGTTIAIGGADGTVHFWAASLSSWARQACRIANRNLTPGEWRQYLGDAPYQMTCPGLR